MAPSPQDTYIGHKKYISRGRIQKICQAKDCFDIRAHIFNNVIVMPQSVLLPIMGGTGNNPGLANNGGQEFHHKIKET
ncbi:MAG: hypothetical protein J6W41_01265 [Alphaproteobacteria bacterium]|nr:hypothetical protein [Alphaproteobacteria bacterium]